MPNGDLAYAEAHWIYTVIPELSTTYSTVVYRETLLYVSLDVALEASTDPQ